MKLNPFKFKLALITLLFSMTSQAQAFKEIDPSRSSKDFRSYIQKGLQVLKEKDNDISKTTLEFILSGRAKIDRIQDLSIEDFGHVIDDINRDYKGLPLAIEDYETFRTGKGPVAEVIFELYAGYIWEDRIYISEGMSPEELAKTLVHEVNHVVNESYGQNFYSSEEAGFAHEYRAFLAEALYEGKDIFKPETQQKARTRVERDYGLSSYLPGIPAGIYVPR